MNIVNILDILKKASIYIVSFGIFAAVLFLFAKYLIPALLPIIIALIIAALIRKPVKLLKEKLNISEKFSSCVLVTVLTGAFCFAAYALIARAYKEIISLSKGIGDFLTRLKTDESYALSLIESISSAFPFFDLRPKLTEIWLNMDSSIEGLVSSVASKLGEVVIPMITDIVSFLPDALLFVVVTVFSAYYISVGGGKMRVDFLKLFPEGVSKKLDSAYKSFKLTMISFLRAYMLIMAITFTELFVMFSVARIEYAFLLALFTAVIDILPVLGTGTVLLPWAAFLIISGNGSKGIAILVIFAAVTVVRQFIEPKIVGDSVGMSPFTSLASMYVGLKLFGAVGLLLAPLCVIGVKNILKGEKQ